MTQENEGGGAAVNKWAFYEDDAGQTRYNETGLSCCRDCKQSFQVKLICCPCYERQKKMQTK